jgi:hypothetical protein
MATQIYDFETLELLDGTELHLSPLKIKYLREFMDTFGQVRESPDEEDAVQNLLSCVAVAMKQYAPEIKTIEQIEDLVNMPMVYKILDIAAGIKMSEASEDSVREQAEDSGSDSSWEKLDLARLESEVFLLGIWKSYDELESSVSMPELVATLEAYRESDYREKKFLAAIQGVDLDKHTSKGSSNAWENLKAKVFSGGKAVSADDVVSLQGVNAQVAGFGIGMGLDYEDLSKN